VSKKGAIRHLFRILICGSNYLDCILWNTRSARTGVGAGDCEVPFECVAVRSSAYGGAVSTSPIPDVSQAESVAAEPTIAIVAISFFMFLNP